MEGPSLNPATITVLNKITDFIATKKNPSSIGDEKVTEEQKDKKPEVSSNRNKPPIQRQEFVWDNIIQWLVTAILGLTILNVSADFFRNYTVTCHVETDRRDEAAYVNNYCYSSLPKSEFFTLYVIIHGFLIIAPHFIWKTLFEAYINFFFDLVKDLDQLKDRQTGEYDPHNFDIVSKVKNHQAPFLYIGYLGKLIVQLLFTVGSFFASGFAFAHEFNEVFDCPNNINESPKGWDLNDTVPCVYPSIRFLQLLQYGDFALLSIIFLVLVYAIFWTAIQCHPKELGYSKIAQFCFESCLNLEDYTFKRKTKYLGPQYDRIRSNMDFLIMMLFRASSGRGATLREMLIEKEIQERQSKDSELLQLFLNQKDEKDATAIFKKANFRAVIKRIGHKGSPRYEIETKYRPKLGLADDMEEPISKEDIKRLTEKLEKRDQPCQDNFVKKLHEGRGFSEKLNDRPKFCNCCYPRRVLPHDDTIGVENALQGWRRNGGTRREVREILEEVFKDDEDILRDTVGTPLDDKEIQSFKNQVYCFLQLVTPHSDKVQRLLAMDISFDSLGCTFILEWAIDSVCSINFQSHLHNKNEPVKCHSLYNQITLIGLPLDFYSSPGTNQTKLDPYLDGVFFDCPSNPSRQQRRSGVGDNTDRYINFMTVGPMKDDARRVTANLLLDQLHTVNDIADNCYLLAIKPLLIGGRDVRKKYLRYTPPYKLFGEYLTGQSKNSSEEEPEESLQLPPIIHDVFPQRGRGTEDTQPLLSSFRLSPIRQLQEGTQKKKKLEDLFNETSFCKVGDVDKGIIAYCAGIRCVFEMKLYRYKIKQSERNHNQ